MSSFSSSSSSSKLCVDQRLRDGRSKVLIMLGDFLILFVIFCLILMCFLVSTPALIVIVHALNNMIGIDGTRLVTC